MPRSALHSHCTAIAAGSVCLLLAWLVYSQALTGTFLLDDEANLDGLHQVDDERAALQFIVSGDSSPLGRPLALATFLPQADSMDSGARNFLRVNILIHLLNAALLACFLNCLVVARRIDQNTRLFVVVTATAIWMFMPMLASASLLVIQRMTTLSAAVVFLSLIGYLHARSIISAFPIKAMVGMSVAVVLGTILALLFKENGALLPTLVLVMECTLLSRPQTVSSRLWRTWQSVFLLLPTLLVIGYLATYLPYSEQLVLARDFDGWERLLSQSRILWEYMIHAFVPRPATFGPFHDGYAVATSIFDPLTFVAVNAWLISAGLAFFLRRRYPVFAFAVFWYLGAHLLESTVLPLELYFEHRNYVPIIGPVLAACLLAVEAPVARKKLAYIGLPLYAMVNAAALAGVTSLWGQPAVAAHFWHERHPESVRAATHLASSHLKVHGEQRALETVSELTQRYPHNAYLAMQKLKYRCKLVPDDNHRHALDQLAASLPGMQFNYSAASALSALTAVAGKGQCQDVDLQAVRELAEAMLQNPRYHQDVAYNQIHQQIMADISSIQGRYTAAIEHLKRASAYKPDSEINTRLVTLYLGTGDLESAREFIKTAYSDAPFNPLKRYEWTSNLDDLTQSVARLEQQQTSKRQQP